MGSGGGRAPCCAKVGLNKGSWTLEEDMKLIAFIQKNGHVNWRALPKLAGLLRCGKSCRLRWINYLRPGIKRGNFTKEEEDSIIKLHGLLGNKWSKIASYLPGRTDNEIKNVWHTHLKKRSNSNSKPVNKDNNLEEALLTSSSSSSSSSFSSRSRSSSSTSQYSCSDHGATKSDEEHNNPSLINITETRDIEEQDKSVAAEEHLGQYSLTTTSTERSDGVNDEEAGAAANGEYGCLVVLPHDIQIDPDHIWSMIEEEDEHWTSGTVESDREGEWLGCLEEELGLRELATVMEVEEEDNHLLHPPPWLQMEEDPVPSCYFSNGIQFSPPPSPLIISFESSTCLELRS